ncbi:MAG: autotransporter outer membrane beta-barrel domain-containing protein [Myxococcota bacterium]
MLSLLCTLAFAREVHERPDGLRLGLGSGLSVSTPTADLPEEYALFSTSLTVAPRLRFSEGFALDPTLSFAHAWVTARSEYEHGGFDETSRQDGTSDEGSLGLRARFRVGEAGGTDLAAIVGADWRSSKTLVEDPRSESWAEAKSSGLAGVLGLGAEHWLAPRLSLNVDLETDVVAYEKSTVAYFEVDEESGESSESEDTIESATFGLRPSGRLMLVLYL